MNIILLDDEGSQLTVDFFFLLMNFVQSVTSPLIAVKASEELNDLAKRNNLFSFSDLLAVIRSGKKVTVRDSQGQACSLDNFSPRFRDFDRLSIDNLNQGLSQPFPSIQHQIRHCKNQAIDIKEFESYTPWFTEYRDLACQFVGVSEHETLNHPVAVIYCCSTQVEDPIQTLKQLAETLPKIYERSLMDTNFLKHFLLVHDPDKADLDPEQIFNQMRRTAGIGLGCSLVTIRFESDDERIPAVFESYVNYTNRILQWQAENQRQENAVDSPGSFSMKCPTGKHWCTENMITLEDFIKDFVVQNLLPHMERCVQHWNEQVASARRGIAGRFFNVGKKYFGGVTAKTNQNNSFVDNFGNLFFTAQSPEMSMRRLADFSFMLRDYQFAYTIYKSVSKDFESNSKALRYYAGAQEMLGLCTLMLEGTGRSSVDTFLESAMTIYKQLGDFHYETRSCILYYEMMKHKNLYKEAPLVLSKLSGEESDWRSALFLEQSAFCCLCSQFPLRRKYSFFLVLAGSRYSKCGQRELAYWCFVNAYQIYDGLGWSLIEDQINFSLGKLSVLKREIQKGAEFFLKLLRHSRQTPAQQAAYLKDFLNIYKQLESTPGFDHKVFTLQIPTLLKTTISLSRSVDEPEQIDELWDQLEQELVDVYSQKSKNKKMMPLSKDGLTCAVGEPVFVHVQVENPLQAQVILKNVSVRCFFGDLPPDWENVVDEDRSKLILVEQEGFTVENIPDLVLQPGEKTSIQVTVIPKQEGTIHLAGLIYLVSDLIPMFKKLSTQRTKGACFKLQVTLPMPILEIDFKRIPDQLVSGEVCEAQMVLHNRGNRGLTNLKVKLSHASFFVIGNLPDKQVIDSFITVQNHLQDVSIRSMDIPGDVLAPGTSFTISWFIRGDRMGNHHCRFVFGYQADGAKQAHNFRLFKWSLTLNVQPSLRINAFTRPSVRALDEFILGMEIENLQQQQSVQLLQVGALSPKWNLYPIDQFNLSESLLGPKQTLYIYFKFCKDKKALQQIPETFVTKVIEKAVQSEDPVVIDTHSLDLNVSQIVFEKTVSLVDPLVHQLSFNSRTNWRQNSLLQQYQGIALETLRNLFTLYYADDIDLCLFWKMENCDRKGQQYIMGINLSLQHPLHELQVKFGVGGKKVENIASRALYAATVRERKQFIATLLKNRMKEVSPLRIVLKSDYHFNFIPEMIIPVQIHLNNTSVQHSAQYIVELLMPETKAQPDFYWHGPSFLNGTLQPEEEQQLQCYAKILHPGVYDLNRWKLHVQLCQESELLPTSIGAFLQTPNLPHFILIN